MPEVYSYQEDQAFKSQKPRSVFAKLISLVLVLVLGSVLFGSIGYFYYLHAVNTVSPTFPAAAFIISEGESAREITTALAKEGYAHSEFILYLELMLKHDPASIKAGTYTFPEPLSIKELAAKITAGDVMSDLVRFTHIEGERAELLASRAAEVLPNFKANEFLTLALPEEGKLFPDTYLVPKDYTAAELFTLLRDTFTIRTEPLSVQITAHKLTLDEIIILASIIEREANSLESMRTVSGILQNRLEIGMALQVDASMEYVLNKPLQELTPEDLTVDSPYNTYLNNGLPPTPIGNPGLEAISAVLTPIPSDYLFYITGNDGQFYYAETFAKHRQNIERYLR